MIVVMQRDATEEDIQRVVAVIESKRDFRAHISRGVERTVIGIIGQIYPELKDELETLPGVMEVLRVSKPYKLASREFHPDDTVVRVGDVVIGTDEVVVMAGPCSVESEQQLLETAVAVKAAGARILRGGAFKPRTSPYSFQGLGVQGLRLLAKAREETGLAIITEVMTAEDVELVATYADILQIGARNVQNFKLLHAVGKVDKPVLLKRGFATTYEEWLLAAEYILAGGNKQVILCERGIRTFETYTRNTLDLAAVPAIKRLSHLPIIVDPSHGTGKWHMVTPMSLAAVAAGAHGLLIEVHPNPDQALSDGAQSLTPENFRKLMEGVRAVASAVGKKVAPASEAVKV
ncbi:MAG: 3-deoxy-7-phosphoheptulonate synthase [Dehalococcoidia bacterium]|nr:3-deoxy-7-phosphoheptulonate synthase [Dehalococcoidia bacterium]MDW8120598.1 3-deoxy-7-phosphoheptulonate synthase [Chloroflexota bacterium]